jgi:hypothetical protein
LARAGAKVLIRLGLWYATEIRSGARRALAQAISRTKI